MGRAIDVKERSQPRPRRHDRPGRWHDRDYARPGDVFRFYEIDSQVPVIANEYFSFLKDSKGKVEIVNGDARLSIEREPLQAYDVLGVDAFSGDAIPAHLITREAVQLFRKHLGKGGILAYHVSNRYLQLGPVLGIIARAEGMTRIADRRLQGRRGKSDPVAELMGAVVERAEALAELQQYGNAPDEKSWPMWTDDYHNLFQVLRPMRRQQLTR